ncbi:hypothetical protein [Tenacibaculum halocynthiae]|uniref:hypothetical protein n=1 Tax=Tenacibaculum halocynthiae TaxID=1254437 RepID=UPI003D6561F1
MKKQTLLIAIFFLFSSFYSQAQFKRKKQSKIQAYKIAYITEKLNLTENEAQKFWPIYNEYSKKMRQLHKEERYKIKKRISKNGDFENISEKDAKKILLKIKSINKKKTVLKNLFFDKLSSFLSYKKALTLEVAEHEFRWKIMKKLHHNKRKKH